MRLPVSHIVVYQGCATFHTEGPDAIKQIRPRAAPSFHTGCIILVTGINIHFVVLQFARGPQVAHPCRTLQLMQVLQLQQTGNLHHKWFLITSQAWASEVFFPGGGAVGDFPKIIFQGGQKWWNLFFTPRNYKKQPFLPIISKSRGTLAPLPTPMTTRKDICFALFMITTNKW